MFDTLVRPRRSPVPRQVAMQIRHTLILLLLTAGLAGCGSDSDENEPGNSAESGQSGSAGEDTRPKSGRPHATGTKPARKPEGMVPQFEMLGPESGFSFTRYDDFQGQHRILETNGGGVALFDFDQDGRLDIYLTNGCRLPVRSDDRSTPGELFQNLGGMKFHATGSESLLMQFGQAHGCAVGDFDGDGFDDLYITAYGRNTLWQNNGDGTFDDVTDAAGVAVPQWSSSAAFADLNGDGHLDLYVANYLDESDESPRLCKDPANPTGYVGCPVSQFDGVTDALFLSDGAGRFVDCTKACGIDQFQGKGLGVVIRDFDGDQVPEIFVANDEQANFLFVADRSQDSPQIPGIPSAPRYQERALRSAVALSEAGLAQASMGVAVGDCDRNGFLDLFLTHFHGDSNTLYLNQGELNFEDSTRKSRLGTTSRQTLGFGTEFLDVNNDGWLDLLIANGHVDDRSWQETPYRMRPQMYRSLKNGSFEEVSSWSGEYFSREWIGRGLATGDLDGDGRVDAVVSHQHDGSAALWNQTVAGNALVLNLIGTKSNRNAVGAQVELSGASIPLVGQVGGGGSFQSASSRLIHLGIGEQQAATVRINWPSGRKQVLNNLASGKWTIVEGILAIQGSAHNRK